MIRIIPYYAMAFMGLLAALATQYFNFSQAGYKKKMTFKILLLTFMSFWTGSSGLWQAIGKTRAYSGCRPLNGLSISVLPHTTE